MPQFFKLMKSCSNSPTNPLFECRSPDCFCYVLLSHGDFMADSCSGKVINHNHQITSEKLQMIASISNTVGNRVFIFTLYQLLNSQHLTIGVVRKVGCNCQIIAIQAHRKDLLKVEDLAPLLFQLIKIEVEKYEFEEEAKKK